MNLILLGAPGAGKGTQAEVICDTLGIPSVSTGNILREAIKDGSALGMEAKAFMDKGQLVPDRVVIDILKERIAKEDCKKGFILDGFPRTVPQAEALDAMGVIIDKVIDLDVEDATIMERLTGRRVCESCGSSYHIVNKPTKVEGVCDRCGGKTVQRKDDAPETIKERLVVYHEQTEPLKDYYAAKGILTAVADQGTLSANSAAVLAAVEA